MALLLALSFAIVGYVSWTTVYRLFLHPIAKFPGPKLAALTKWYEFYFDVIKAPGGQYSKRIEEMHKQYGPIVRVNPDELHISDPDFYEPLYSGKGKRDKWKASAQMGGWDIHTFGTVEHDLHKSRRAANMPLMAKRYVVEALPMIRQQLRELESVFKRAAKDGKPLELGTPFLAFTTDIVGEFFLRRPLGMQADHQKAKEWKQATHQIAVGTPIVKQFPWALKAALKIPVSFWKLVAPDVAALLNLHFGLKARAEAFLEEIAKDPKVDLSLEGKPKSLFRSIYERPDHDAHRLLTRLWHEGVTVITAGGETTAKVLTRMVYEIVSNPGTIERLRLELETAASEASKPIQDLDLAQLERLPWLTAIVKESLRISALITGRLPICPHDPLRFREWTIPAMTPVSLTPYNVLKDPNIYPEPEAFQPERWLDVKTAGGGLRSDLERYFVPFGKGPRMCQGMNLAWTELYLVLVMLVTKFDVELHDVIKERDIDYVADCFLGEVRKDSPGVHVTVKIRDE